MFLNTIPTYVGNSIYYLGTHTPRVLIYDCFIIYTHNKFPIIRDTAMYIFNSTAVNIISCYNNNKKSKSIEICNP